MDKPAWWPENPYDSLQWPSLYEVWQTCSDAIWDSVQAHMEDDIAAQLGIAIEMAKDALRAAEDER